MCEKLLASNMFVEDMFVENCSLLGAVSLDCTSVLILLLLQRKLLMAIGPRPNALVSPPTQYHHQPLLLVKVKGAKYSMMQEYIFRENMDLCHSNLIPNPFNFHIPFHRLFPQRMFCMQEPLWFSMLLNILSTLRHPHAA